jgi:UrcA family protein
MFDTRKMACFGAAAFLGTLVIGAAATPLHAQERPVTVTARPDQLTRVVPYGDLSLATKQGRHILMHRVDVAVDQVCPQMDEFLGRLDDAYCKHFAWAGARPQIRRAFDSALAGQPMAMSALVITVAPGN